MTIAFALSPMAEIIGAMYQITKGMNDGINDLIDNMQSSENSTISRTGRVLEGAKAGFMIGYITPVVVIAAGQLILGHPLAAVVAAGTMACNPFAMTCAAVGAIVYGWNALTPQEREETLEKLSKGLEVGIELIKSIIRFVIEKTKEILSSENTEELKKYIGSVAAIFGKKLSDVTGKFSDVVSDTFDNLKKKSDEVVAKTGGVASEIVIKAGETINKTGEMASETYDTMKEASGKVADRTIETLKNFKSGDQSKKSTDGAESTSLPTSSASPENGQPS